MSNTNGFPTNDNGSGAMGPTSVLLERALSSLRTFAGEAPQAEALAGVASFTIHHAIETLRRAGLGDEARKILVAELNDLDLARASSRQSAKIIAAVSRSGVTRMPSEILADEPAAPASQNGELA